MSKSFDTPEGEVIVDLPEGQGPQCTSVPVMKQTKTGPESMPRNIRSFPDGDVRRVHVTISRNVRRSFTLKEVLKLAVQNVVGDPDARVSMAQSELVFSTNLQDRGEIQDLVAAINREFQYQRDMLKNRRGSRQSAQS